MNMRSFYVRYVLFFTLFVVIILGGYAFYIHQKEQSLISPVITENHIAWPKKAPPATPTPAYIPSVPTLETIFSTNHSWTNNIPEDRKRVIIATGDVIPARMVNVYATQYNNFTWPYEKTADILKNADLTFINLETSLIKNCPLIYSGFTFCGNEKNVEGLVFSGVDMASLANNHTGNFGSEAVVSTKALLNNHDIQVTGTGGSTYTDIKGKNFAFLAYNDIGGRQEGISWADEKRISEDIQEAKKNADYVVVAYHWGAEYRAQPDERQKYLGHFTIDAGADLIIGNHPHWIQPIEFYKGKLITYAHGNFVFDQEWSLKTKQGIIGRYTFYDTMLVDVEYIPIQIEHYGQPRVLEGEEKMAILQDIKAQSQILASQAE